MLLCCSTEGLEEVGNWCPLVIAVTTSDLEESWFSLDCRGVGNSKLVGAE